VLGVTLFGAVVAVYSIVDLVRHPVGLAWFILLLLTVGSGWAMLRIPAMPISFSISDIFNIVAALLFGPSAGAISAAVDGLVVTSRFANSQRTLDRVLFNMAAPTVATWFAAQVFFALGGHQPVVEAPFALVRLLALLIVFGAIDFGVNSGLVATAVGFERRLPPLTVWREHFADMWITYFGGIFGAMLLMVLSRFHMIDVLVLLVPLPVILYVTCRHAIGRAEDQLNHLAKVNRVYIAAIEALAHAVDAKDQVTHDHTRRVQDEAVRLARALHIEDDGELQAIKAAALLHDVGKLAIPEHILNKPGRLTPAEFDIMKRHAAIGADILSVIGLPFAVVPIVRHHHENWDGSGYPDAIAGDAIPIGSRILAVVDCFDALTSDRPYRPRMDTRDALAIVRERSGTMYDPRVVDAFALLLAETDSPQVAAAPIVRPTPQPEPAPQPRIEPHVDDVQFRTFFELGRAVDRVSWRELGELVWTHAKAHVPASAFVLYTYNDGNDAIIATYAGGDAGAVDATAIPLGARLSGWVAATGQTAMNSDARLDFADAARDDSSLRSALAVPIATNGRCAGVLSFYAEGATAFDETHRRFVETLGKVVGDAMHRDGTPVSQNSPAA